MRKAILALFAAMMMLVAPHTAQACLARFSPLDTSENGAYDGVVVAQITAVNPVLSVYPDRKKPYNTVVNWSAYGVVQRIVAGKADRKSYAFLPTTDTCSQPVTDMPVIGQTWVFYLIRDKDNKDRVIQAYPLNVARPRDTRFLAMTPMKKAEIQAFLSHTRWISNTGASESYDLPGDGSYRRTGPYSLAGTYRVSDGQFCIDNGSTRCVQVAKDADDLVYFTQPNGTRLYPPLPVNCNPLGGVGSDKRCSASFNVFGKEKPH